MEPSTRTPSITAAIAAVAALAVLGCNALLDNRPGDINADLFAAEPEGDAGALGEAGRDAGARMPVPDPSTAPGSDTSPDGGETLPLQCLVGTKPCGDLCVSIDDPYYGCAGPTCERCAPIHGAGACVAGQCATGTCTAGWADCNHLPADGCEADLTAVASCGACGVTCAKSPHADAACVAGACKRQCATGFADCNKQAADGCETEILEDKHNCGECGRTCLIGTCEAGTCVLKL